MDIALWIAQGLLAILFGIAGIMKITQPMDKLVQSGLNWVERLPLPVVKFIGLAELLGAIGLILPWALGILLILTPLAACGLALIMLFASIHHFRHLESPAIVFVAVLFLLAAFVAYERYIAL